MQRVVTGVVLAALLVASALFLPTPALVGALTIVAALALLELLSLLVPGTPRTLRVAALLGLGVVLALLLATESETELAIPPLLLDDLLLFACLALPLLAALGLRREMAQRARVAVSLGFAWIYISLAVASCAQLHRTDPRLVVVLLAIVGVGDTAALYFGKAFGRRRLAPSVSPNKSWEGAMASLVAGGGVGLVAAWWLGVDPLAMFLISLLASLFGQLGDLLESMLKRAVAVKDSGTLLPGHGGILDRADAAILAAPIFRIGTEWLL